MDDWNDCNNWDDWMTGLTGWDGWDDQDYWDNQECTFHIYAQLEDLLFKVSDILCTCNKITYKRRVLINKDTCTVEPFSCRD